MSSLTSEKIVIPVNGTATAVTLTGKGHPLLLFHGGEGSRKSFARLAAMLAEDFTVIAHDQRDSGDTVNEGPPAALAELAADAKELLHVLGYEQASVFGSSFGGRVAQVMALLHPASVVNLVLGSTWAADQKLRDLNQQIFERVSALRDELPASAPLLADLYFSKSFLTAQPSFRLHFGSAPPRTVRTDRRGVTIREALGADPSHIKARTLVLAGGADILVPPAVTADLARRVPGATLKLLEGVGHISYLETPERVASLIREFCLDADVHASSPLVD
jgi:pimeloyl-ACP methyl ester carboxylesterase